MDGSLLILSDIIKLYDFFSGGLKLDGLPFGIVGEVVILHDITNQIFSNYTFGLSYFPTNTIIYNYEEKLRTKTWRTELK